MCTKCDDAMEDESFVRASYQLCFRIADDDGTTLDVSVSDERVGAFPFSELDSALIMALWRGSVPF